MASVTQHTSAFCCSFVHCHWYLIVWIHHHYPFYHWWVFGLFLVLTTANSTACTCLLVNMLSICLGAKLLDNKVCECCCLNKHWQWVFQSDCTNWRFQYQCLRVPVDLGPHQYWILPIFSILVLLWICSGLWCGFNLSFPMTNETEYLAILLCEVGCLHFSYWLVGVLYSGIKSFFG